jgi:N4-gp56 family major capsid protein
MTLEAELIFLREGQMATNTLASNFSSDVATYIAAKTLLIAKKYMAFYQICDKVALPHNSSRTFQYTRFDRLNLPQTVLSEGVTPSDTSMAISTVTAVMDQWGAVVPISDVAIDSVKHPVLQQAIELLGYQAAETMDREIIKVALSGTQIYYPGTASSRGTLASTDKITSIAMGKVVSFLRIKGAMPYDGSMLVGVLDPFSEDDLIANDSTFIQASQYSRIKNLFNQEVGTWKGVRWIRSNTLPQVKLATGASIATSATGGSLAISTTYNAKLTVVDSATGFETFITAVLSGTTGGAATSIDVTVPALPSGATAGSTFNLYFGSNGGTLYLAATGIAASTTYNQKTLPTSGTVAPATPVTGFGTHFAFVFGKQALACVELNKIKSYLTPAVASDSDPLVQRRKAGWKCDFKTVICNDNFMARLEHATTNAFSNSIGRTKEMDKVLQLTLVASIVFFCVAWGILHIKQTLLSGSFGVTHSIDNEETVNAAVNFTIFDTAASRAKKIRTLTDLAEARHVERHEKFQAMLRQAQEENAAKGKPRAV